MSGSGYIQEEEKGDIDGKLEKHTLKDSVERHSMGTTETRHDTEKKNGNEELETVNKSTMEMVYAVCWVEDM